MNRNFTPKCRFYSVRFTVPAARLHFLLLATLLNYRQRHRSRPNLQVENSLPLGLLAPMLAQRYICIV